MTHSLTLAEGKPVDLNCIANQLRRQIDKLPPDQPPLMVRPRKQQTASRKFW